MEVLYEPFNFEMDVINRKIRYLEQTVIFLIAIFMTSFSIYQITLGIRYESLILQVDSFLISLDLISMWIYLITIGIYKIISKVKCEYLNWRRFSCIGTIINVTIVVLICLIYAILSIKSLVKDYNTTSPITVLVFSLVGVAFNLPGITIFYFYIYYQLKSNATKFLPRFYKGCKNWIKRKINSPYMELIDDKLADLSKDLNYKEKSILTINSMNHLSSNISKISENYNGSISSMESIDHKISLPTSDNLINKNIDTIRDKGNNKKVIESIHQNPKDLNALSKSLNTKTLNYYTSSSNNLANNNLNYNNLCNSNTNTILSSSYQFGKKYNVQSVRNITTETIDNIYNQDNSFLKNINGKSISSKNTGFIQKKEYNTATDTEYGAKTQNKIETNNEDIRSTYKQENEVLSQNTHTDLSIYNNNKILNNINFENNEYNKNSENFDNTLYNKNVKNRENIVYNNNVGHILGNENMETHTNKFVEREPSLESKNKEKTTQKMNSLYSLLINYFDNRISIGTFIKNYLLCSQIKNLLNYYHSEMVKNANNNQENLLGNTSYKIDEINTFDSLIQPDNINSFKTNLNDNFNKEMDTNMDGRVNNQADNFKNNHLNASILRKNISFDKMTLNYDRLFEDFVSTSSYDLSISSKNGSILFVTDTSDYDSFQNEMYVNSHFQANLDSSHNSSLYRRHIQVYVKGKEKDLHSVKFYLCDIIWIIITFIFAITINTVKKEWVIYLESVFSFTQIILILIYTYPMIKYISKNFSFK